MKYSKPFNQLDEETKNKILNHLFEEITITSIKGHETISVTIEEKIIDEILKRVAIKRVIDAKCKNEIL